MLTRTVLPAVHPTPLRRYRLDGLPNATGDSYSLWLNEMVDHFGVTADLSLLHAAATDIVSAFKADITGKAGLLLF